MALDISALMQDPQMQFGLGLLGAGRSLNPIADATAMMTSMQNAQAQHQLQAQQIERMKQQTLNEKQQQALGLLGYLQNTRLLNSAMNINPQTGAPLQPESSLPNPAMNLPPALAGLLPQQATGLTQQVQQNQAAPVPSDQQSQFAQPPSNGMPLAAPVGQPPTQQVPTGKFGTPQTLLNNLIQIESSGNPHAIGPSVPGQGNAMGLYQFMPNTVNTLKKQGIDFNPLVPDQRLHDAADFYFQQLLKQNGGDVTKALNAWQGASKTAGSNANLQYNAKALAGVQMPPTGMPQPQQAGTAATPISGVPANSQALASAYRAGVLGLAQGDKGANMAKYAEMLKPQAVTSGATVLGPNGQASQLPMSPLQQQQTANETPGANGMTPADVSKMGMQNLQTAQEKVAASRELVKDIPQTLDALNQAKATLPNIINYQGPIGERRLQIAKALNQVFPGVLNIDQNALTSADTFKSQVTQPLLASVKTTGGRMSVQEIGKMQQNFGSLETDPGAMKSILDIMSQRYQNTLSEHNRLAQQFDKMMGPTAHLDYSVTPNAAPTVGPAAAPQVGFTKGGFMFKGGDPSNKASWVPVPGGQ